MGKGDGESRRWGEAEHRGKGARGLGGAEEPATTHYQQGGGTASSAIWFPLTLSHFPLCGFFVIVASGSHGRL